VTPRHTKRTASVEEARKAAQEVSDKTGATARAKRKAEALKEAVRTSCQERADMASQPSVSDARLADLEAKIEALLALQAMGHDMMRNENEVLFSDLPFDPDFNHYEG
jgi:flagellar biosynthesis GTPase FlhF